MGLEFWSSLAGLFWFKVFLEVAVRISTGSMKLKACLGWGIHFQDAIDMAGKLVLADGRGPQFFPIQTPHIKHWAAWVSAWRGSSLPWTSNPRENSELGLVVHTIIPATFYRLYRLVLHSWEGTIPGCHGAEIIVGNLGAGLYNEIHTSFIHLITVIMTTMTIMIEACSVGAVWIRSSQRYLTGTWEERQVIGRTGGGFALLALTWPLLRDCFL